MLPRDTKRAARTILSGRKQPSRRASVGGFRTLEKESYKWLRRMVDGLKPWQVEQLREILLTLPKRARGRPVEKWTSARKLQLLHEYAMDYEGECRRGIDRKVARDQALEILSLRHGTSVKKILEKLGQARRQFSEKALPESWRWAMKPRGSPPYFQS